MLVTTQARFHNAEMVEALVKGRKYKFCVAARDFESGEEILYNPSDLCVTASTFKVPILIELMRRYELGEVSLDDFYMLREEDKSPGSGVLRELSPGITLRIRDLATLMIIRSDNTATDILINMLGAGNITSTMHKLGFCGTYVTMGCAGLIGYLHGIKTNWPTPEQKRAIMSRPPDAKVDEDAMTLKGVPENCVTTPLDMVNLFHRLHDGTLLGPKGNHAALAILLRQQIKERIPGLLPKGTLTANKTGTLAGRIINDAGIVYPRSGSPYAVAIFTDQEDVPDAKDMPARISLAIYEHFQKKR